MIESLLQNLTTDAAGESLSALCSEAKTKAGRAAIEAALSDRSALYSLLKSDSPKVRKNTYRLIGALQNKEDIRALEEALQTETTLFAVPSLLLALGALGAKDALCRYTVPASEGPEQDKHIAAIEAAYEKATQQFDRVKAEPLCRLPAAREILCCAPKGFAAELADELEESFKESAQRVHTALITYAARDSEFDGQAIKAGEHLALLDGKLLGSYPDVGAVFVDLNKAFEGLSPEFLTIYFGADVTAEDAEVAKSVLGRSFPDADISVVDGGQPVYYYMISAE